MVHVIFFFYLTYQLADQYAVRGREKDGIKYFGYTGCGDGYSLAPTAWNAYIMAEMRKATPKMAGILAVLTFTVAYYSSSVSPDSSRLRSTASIPDMPSMDPRMCAALRSTFSSCFSLAFHNFSMASRSF